MKEICLGQNFIGFLDANGIVSTWGTNISGVLGIGEAPVKTFEFPLNIPALKNRPVNSIRSGSNFFFALGVNEKVGTENMVPSKETRESINLYEIQDHNSMVYLPDKNYKTQAPNTPTKQNAFNFLDSWPNS